MTLEQRRRRRPQHLAQQRFHPRHARLQPLLDRRIADPLLQQGEVARRLPQHQIDTAVVHHHLEQLLLSFDLATAGERLELERQFPEVGQQILYGLPNEEPDNTQQ